MTLLDVQNLVKRSRDMETHGRAAHRTILIIWPSHLILSQPTLAAEAKLQLVSVAINLFAAQNRHKLRQFHLPNTGQVVIHLLLFRLQLLLILETLPLTSSTHTIVLAFRYGAQRRILVELHSHSLHIGVLFLLYL